MAASMRNLKCQTVLRGVFALNREYLAVPCLQKSTTTKNQPVKATPTQYCLDLVKKCDFENYLCTLLYGQDYRTSAMALRALYIEMAMVQEVTSDKMRAVMRLQFWKDTIEKIFNNTPPETPVALAVTAAVNKHKLSKLWFTRILEERVRQVENETNRTVKNVEDAAENTVSALTYLFLEAAGIKDVNADHAASHIGRCYGLVTLLRATKYHASKNRVLIPIELLIKHQVSQEQILRCKEDQEVKNVMYDIACVAHSHLETARKIEAVPKQAYPIFLHSLICERYLRSLQLADFNVFHDGLHVRKNNLMWKLCKQRYWKRTY